MHIKPEAYVGLCQPKVGSLQCEQVRQGLQLQFQTRNINTWVWDKSVMK